MTVIKKILWLLEVLLLLGVAVATGLLGLGFGPPEGVEPVAGAFGALGLPPLGVQILSGIHIAAGAFLLLLPTRRSGCLLLVAAFGADAAGLFLSGQGALAGAAFLFVALVFVPLIWVTPKRFGQVDIYT